MNKEIARQILDMFVLKGQNVRPKFEHPMFDMKHNRVIATECYILVSIDASLVDDYEKLEPFDFDFGNDKNVQTSSMDISELETAIGKVNFVEEYEDIEEIECDECCGEGTVYCDYEDSHGRYHTVLAKCPICSGTGTLREQERIKTGNTIPDELEFLQIGEYFYKAKHMAIILKAMHLAGIESMSYCFDKKGTLGFVHESIAFRIACVHIDGDDFSEEHIIRV